MVALVVATGQDTFFGRAAKFVQSATSASRFQKAVLQIGDCLRSISVRSSACCRCRRAAAPRRLVRVADPVRADPDRRGDPGRDAGGAVGDDGRRVGRALEDEGDRRAFNRSRRWPRNGRALLNGQDRHADKERADARRARHLPEHDCRRVAARGGSREQGRESDRSRGPRQGAGSGAPDELGRDRSRRSIRCANAPTPRSRTRQMFTAMGAPQVVLKLWPSPASSYAAR